MRKSNYFFLLFILIFTACNQTEEPVIEEQITSTDEIDAALQPFFTRFEAEAAERGIDIDLAAEGITGVIEEISTEHVAGTCTYGSHLPGDVVIDLEFWNNSSDLIKEMVIFHELGHCFLRRDHAESAFANGTCTSIMRSGTGDCRDNYNSGTREDYIDELFSRQ